MMPEIRGMSERSGLLCRYGFECEEAFLGSIPEAAVLRNAHEVAVHGYEHKPYVAATLKFGHQFKKQNAENNGAKRKHKEVDW